GCLDEAVAVIYYCNNLLIFKRGIHEVQEEFWCCMNNENHSLMSMLKTHFLKSCGRTGVIGGGAEDHEECVSELHKYVRNSTREPADTDDDKPLSITKIRDPIANMNSKKAPGEDGVTSKILGAVTVAATLERMEKRAMQLRVEETSLGKNMTTQECELLTQEKNKAYQRMLQKGCTRKTREEYQIQRINEKITL
ncbi:hypothetical protein C0J52_26895, partial [Blattella germanica]